MRRRFRGADIFSGFRQPEKVAGPMEGEHLAVAALQRVIGPHDAVD